MADNFGTSNMNSFRQPSNLIENDGVYGGPTIGTVPPQLPPRNYLSTTPIYNVNNQYGGGYGNYGSYGGYGGYGGYNSYSGMSGYGGFGGYRPGFGAFGSNYGANPANPENRFIQIAESSVRPAFESFQSILGVLGSVTMMFESTFHAVQASYASVIGVADNFSKLRSMFGRVLSVFTYINGINYLYRRLLYLIGLTRKDPRTEAAWNEAMNEGLNVATAVPPGSPQPSSFRWTTAMFLGLVMAGPYLLFKLISRISPPEDMPPATWNPRQNPGSKAYSLFPFQAATERELSFRSNQQLMIAPSEYQTKNTDWVLACDSTGRIGFVPHNYVNANVKTWSRHPQPFNVNSEQLSTAWNAALASQTTPNQNSNDFLGPCPSSSLNIGSPLSGPSTENTPTNNDSDVKRDSCPTVAVNIDSTSSEINYKIEEKSVETVINPQ